MKRNSSKTIYLTYLIYTIVYFTIAALCFESNTPGEKNLIIAFLYSLSNLLYWLTAILLYLMSMIISAIIGMIYFRNHTKNFVIFRAIAIISTILLLLGVVASNL